MELSENYSTQLFLKNYMRNLLLQRNEVIKEYAETQKWKAILN